MKLIIALFLCLTACILSHPALSAGYATLGMELWLYKMVPALLPFMILSGVMVRLHLTEKIAMVLYPAVGRLYRVRKNVVYCMALGFLCGFPMGARVTADLYERELLSRREAEYLLAFCNNIGPVYFCSFALPMLGRRLVLPYLFGMYGIPLLYGAALRLTLFRELPPGHQPRFFPPALRTGELQSCSDRAVRPSDAVRPSQRREIGLLAAVNESIQSSLESILTLGGYMILFNLLNLPVHLLLGRKPALLAPLLEITGGLSMLGSRLPLYSFLVLSFGGLSCIAQTYSCISGTDLSLSSYALHRICLTLLTGLFYLLWFLLFPGSFLR